MHKNVHVCYKQIAVCNSDSSFQSVKDIRCAAHETMGHCLYNSLATSLRGCSSEGAQIE